MKLIKSILLVVLILIISCKQDKKDESGQSGDLPSPELTVPEKIANAHGFQNWKNVKEIGFTFNVDREDSHFERNWIWFPKSNNVVHMTTQDTLRYNRKNMDSVAYKVNAGFINDRFWFFAPYNLIWDKNGYAYNHIENDSAPISKKPMQRLTITYKNEGGYTPGDAYDFYFNDDYIIREWVFRKSNEKEPSMITTWESYLDTLGLKLATQHKNNEGDFSLYFDGLVIETVED